MLRTDERLAEFDGFIQVVTHARVPRVGNRAAMPECTGPELAPSLEPPDHGAAGDIGRRCVRGIGHPLAPHQPAARVDRGLDLRRCTPDRGSRQRASTPAALPQPADGRRAPLRPRCPYPPPRASRTALRTAFHARCPVRDRVEAHPAAQAKPRLSRRTVKELAEVQDASLELGLHLRSHVAADVVEMSRLGRALGQLRDPQRVHRDAVVMAFDDRLGEARSVPYGARPMVFPACSQPPKMYWDAIEYMWPRLGNRRNGRLASQRPQRFTTTLRSPPSAT